MDFEKLAKENPHLLDGIITKKIDAHFFNDPFALQVSFAPINPGGKANHTYELRVLSSGDLKFVASNFESAFIKIMALVSAIATVYFTINVFRPDLFGRDLPESIDTFSWIKIFFSGTFLLASLNEIFALKNQSLISQKHRKVFLKGKKPIAFDQIHAVQFLIEACPSQEADKTHYLSFETNLVLKNTERVHLVDQANYLESLAEAQKIAKVLHVPLWDAVKAKIKTTELVAR